MFNNAYSNKINRNARLILLGLCILFMALFVLGLVSLLTSEFLGKILSIVLVNHCARLSLECLFVFLYLRKITTFGKMISLNGYKMTLSLGIAFAILWAFSFATFVVTGFSSIASTLLVISVLTILLAYFIKAISLKIGDYIQDSSYDTSYLINQVKQVLRAFRR